MIRLQQLSCGVGPYSLLEGVDFTLSRGCVAVIGPNGAGKSTLLQLCADGGRHHPGSHVTGQLELDGRALRAWPAEALAQRRAVLSQQQADTHALPVAALLGLATWPWGGGPLPASLLDEAVARWELAGLLPRSYTGLSGGERQRVHLARTWLQLRLQPKPGRRLWLLDEPQAALDLPHQQALLVTLRGEAAAGALVVFSTHDINFALRAADRILGLRQGRLVADATAEAFADPECLRELYGVDFVRLTHPVDRRPLLVPG